MQKSKTRRTLKEQTIKDSFLFEAVMTDGDNCKDFLELVLGKKLTEIKVYKERDLRNHPEYKGPRLDIFATDEHGTRYNIEMQVVTEHTELRSRYYHSQMDMDILLAGTDYEYLPESYVIFICDYDPLGYNKYVYTMETKCREVQTHEYRDGIHTIFLSTKGTNDNEVSEEIVKFLKYVKASLAESENDFGSELVTKMQQSVRRIKRNRAKEREYMVWDEVKKKEREEGREEQAEITARNLSVLGMDETQIAAVVGFSVSDVERWLAYSK